MKKIALLVFCFFLLKGYGQVNLVPNHSFEIYDTCPYYSNQIYFASPWFQPCIIQGNTTNSSSSDLFDTCSTPGMFGIPFNAGGYQIARTGRGYAGIALYSNGFNSNEYIEVKLISPLIQTRKYCIEFYVSLLNGSDFAISNVGAYFSQDSLLSNTYYNAIDNVSPQVENPTTNMLSDTLNWMLVSGNFIANGGEQYMTIGNFHLYNVSNVQNVSGGSFAVAYYYIDDVSVVDCTGVGISEVNDDNEINVSPNPANNQFTVENSQLRINVIHIYSVLGEEVFSNN